jgi:hypothetical protein
LNINPKVCVTANLWGVDVVENFLRNQLPKQLTEVATTKVGKIAKEKAKEIRHNIFAQLYKHIPLNPQYRADKIRKGFDSRILLRTKTYASSIGVWRRKKKNVIEFSVGVPSNKRNLDGVLLKDIGRWLEFGTSKMVARPHFSPVLFKMKAQLPSYIRQINKEIDLHFKKKLAKIAIKIKNERSRPKFRIKLIKLNPKYKFKIQGSDPYEIKNIYKQFSK